MLREISLTRIEKKSLCWILNDGVPSCASYVGWCLISLNKYMRYPFKNVPLVMKWIFFSFRWQHMDESTKNGQISHMPVTCTVRFNISNFKQQFLRSVYSTNDDQDRYKLINYRQKHLLLYEISIWKDF